MRGDFHLAAGLGQVEFSKAAAIAVELAEHFPILAAVDFGFGHLKTEGDGVFRAAYLADDVSFRQFKRRLIGLIDAVGEGGAVAGDAESVLVDIVNGLALPVEGGCEAVGVVAGVMGKHSG